MGDYRVKVSVRNARFLRAIESLGLSATGFAKKYGFQPTEVCGIAAMTKSPIYSNGDWKPSVMKLCDLANVMPDDLFTRKQKYELLKSNHVTRDVNESEVASIIETSRLAICAANPEDTIIRREMLNEIAAILDDIPPRERAVFTARRVEGLTLEEIGSEIGVTRERVRQIDIRALRRIKKKIVGNKSLYCNSMLEKMGMPCQ